MHRADAEAGGPPPCLKKWKQETNNCTVAEVRLLDISYLEIFLQVIYPVVISN